MNTLKPRLHSPNEFSRFVKVSEVPRIGASFELTPKPLELQAICKRLELLGLSKFIVHANLKALPGEAVYALTGKIEAEFIQACSLTDTPIAGILFEDFSYLFSKKTTGDETSDDPPEPLEAGGIDIGEVAVQHLSLALPAFPRLGAVALEQFIKENMPELKANIILADDPDYDLKIQEISEEAEEATAPNPFERLLTLKKS